MGTRPRVKLDGVFPCSSYEIPVESASLDLIFCYAAAHHFMAHRRTLREIHRVLAPAGIACICVNPPARASCIACLLARQPQRHGRAGRRADPPQTLPDRPRMRIRTPGRFSSRLSESRLLETNYYFLLSKLPFLQAWFRVAQTSSSPRRREPRLVVFPSTQRMRKSLACRRGHPSRKPALTSISLSDYKSVP